jgi:hypothetical protein
VTPHPGGLDHARGAIPLGTALLEVDWQEPECGRLGLRVRAPDQMKGDVLLPVVRQDALVTLDGLAVWEGGPVEGHQIEMTEAGLLLRDLDGGLHQIEVTFACYLTYLPALLRTE